jgi:ABC-type transport system involved in cytochrome c biogenesis permease component
MKLYLSRDLRCLLNNRQTIVLPFVFFLIAFGLFKGLGIIATHKSLAAFQVLMTLSTVGFMRGALQRDFNTGILDVVLDHTTALMPFLMAKFLSIGLFQWLLYLGTWCALSLLGPQEFGPLASLHPILALTALSFTLTLLILLIDALLLKSSYNAFLGIILILPFIVPIILVSSLSNAPSAIKAPAFLAFYTLSFMTVGLNAIAFILKRDRFT